MKTYKFYVFIFLALLPILLYSNITLKAESNIIEAANNLAELWIIVDKSSDTDEYRIDSTITRREMLKIMMKISGQNIDDKCNGEFNDLHSNDWGYKYAETALSLWYIASNMNFRPDDNVSKIEALKMIFKAKWIQREENSDWRQWYVNTAIEKWIVNSFNDFDTSSTRWWIFTWTDNTIKIIDNWDTKVCTMEYAPVCWIDWKTYSNKCMAWNTKILHEWECLETQINKNNNIEIVFDSEMDKTSVLSNLKVYPEVESNFIWIDDKTLNIEIKEEVNEDTDFIINIWKEATDINWSKLEETIVKKFKISWDTKIDFISPEWKITDLTKNITVRFSKPITKLTNFDNQTICPIIITPELPWKCVWITTSTFQYRPDNGFPIWANYKVTIPKWVKTISWDYTIDEETIEITTPSFEVINNSKEINKDEELLITFNDNVNIEDFKNNFLFTWLEKDKLNIKYFEYKISDEITETKKNIISIYPKEWDWWYWKNYQYIIKSNLTSSRWNIWLLWEINSKLSISNLLTDYLPFIYINNDSENKEAIMNLRFSNNKNIININNPKILLNFHEEIKLDKSLFNINSEAWNSYDFNIKYLKRSNNIDWEQIIKEDRKSIIIEIVKNDNSNINLTINSSKISKESVNNILNFKTKEYNSLITYKFIDYNQHCITFKNPINTYVWDYSAFDFWDNSKVSYISKINNWSKNENCKYTEWKNTYLIYTQLTPNKEYTLNIWKNLLDTDNYWLDNEYSYNFKTNIAKNDDKNVNIIDNREIILVPTDITPLWVWIKTINLNKVQVKVCEWNLDIENIDYIKNETCETKTIDINNLWFKTNISVINLEQIFWKNFDKELITLKVNKLIEDKTEYEIKNEESDYYTERKIHFIRTNKSAILKSNWKNSLLWLSDYRSWELLNDEVSQIDKYNRESSYSSYWKYLWMVAKFSSTLNYESIWDWLYELSWDPSWYLLITLKNWEKIFLDTNYLSRSYINNKIYITTDRPLYKAGNKVNINWVIRELKENKYYVSNNNYIIKVTDPRYKEVFSEKFSPNENWTFNIDFDLNLDATLWNYIIEIEKSFSLNTYNKEYYNFTVEEFEKPDFKIDINSKKDYYLYSDSPKVDISSEYYIWSPLSNWKWKYNIDTIDYNFDWWNTKDYLWGENQTFYWWNNFYNRNSKTIEYWKVFTLDSNWKTSLNIDTNNTIKDKTYIVTTTITDPNTSKSISNSTNFKLLNSDIFVWMKFNKYFYDIWDTAKLDFITVDTEGNKKANIDLKFKVYKIDYEYNEDTFQTNKNEKIILEENLNSQNIATNNISYTFDESWEYRFEVELANWKYKTSKSIYVSWYNVVRPIEQNNDLIILKDKEEYNIWDNAEFIIQSEVTWVKALVTVEKNDQILLKDVIDITSNSQKYSINIKKEYLPNFELKVFIIKSVNDFSEVLEELKTLRLSMQDLEEKIYWEEENIIIPYYICYDLLYKWWIIPNNDYEWVDKVYFSMLAKNRALENKLMQKIIPWYYSWKSEVKVNLDSIKINSDIILDKDSYLPSDKQNITINLTDNNWTPINGELVISIVDEALLALKNNDTDIIDFFYSNNPNLIQTKINLEKLIKRLEFKEEEITTQVNSIEEERWFLESAPIEMMKADMWDFSMDSMEMAESLSFDDSEWWSWNNNSVKIRTDFKDSAFYKAQVKIVDWVANIAVPKLPDNLTTWVIKWYAITNDTKVGNFTKDFKVQKQLNILPSIPRFFVVNDETEISWVLINNSNNNLNTTISIEASNLEFENNTIDVNIPAKSQWTFNFKVLVKNKTNDIKWEEYKTSIKIIAKSWDLIDAIEVKKDIIPYSTPEYTFSNWSTYNLSYEDVIFLPENIDKDLGELDVSIWWTILTNLLDSIENLVSMPMDNFYSTISSLRTASVLKWLYDKAWEIEKYNELTVIDYLWVEHKLDSVVKDRIIDFKNYQNTDWWMMYYDDCIDNSYKNCSNLNLTWEFLNTALKLKNNWYIINQDVVNKALNYYKIKLEETIKNYELQWYTYRDITPFYTILGYDSIFIKKYIITERFINSLEKSNIEKLQLIKILQTIDSSNTKINEYIKDIKNSIIIEARWSLVPSNNYSKNNSLSTALALDIFINDWETEKLIIENLVRWLVYQKNENWTFDNRYNSSIIIESITKYITYTKELDDMNFEAKWYLNSKEIINSIFNNENKFDITKKSLNIKDYINLWIDNSIWFEKTWSWKLYYDLWLRYYLPIENINPSDEWIIINRNYYNFDDYKNAFKQECYTPYIDYYYGSFSNCYNKKIKNIIPVNWWSKWDYLVWEIELIIPHERNNVIINNFIPSWTELININLNTTSNELKALTWQENNTWWWWYDHIENQTDKIVLYADKLYKWTYKYTYVIKLNHKWIFHHRPAVAEEIKKPEIWWRTKWEFFEIK